MRLLFAEKTNLIACFLLGAGFVFQEATPFFLSTGAILWGVSALIHPDFNLRSGLNYGLVLLWLLGLISLLWTTHRQEGVNIVIRQLGLLLFPLGFCSPIASLNRRVFFGSFLFWVSLFALISLLRYLLYFDLVNHALQESGAVPVWNGTSLPWQLTAASNSKFVESGINHIYFSILQALAIVFCLSRLLINKKQTVYWFVLVLNVLIIHLFLARTGLMALYFSMVVLLVYLVFKQPSFRPYLKYSPLFLLLPLLIYFSSDGVQKKVSNSLTDFRAAGQSTDINHRSFAMRLEAWKNVAYLLKSNYLIGTGIGDVMPEMQKAYRERQTPLFEENRLPPHNQYLETSLAMGITGLIFLLLALIQPFIRAWKSDDIWFFLIVAIVFFAFLFESLLQTQLGVALCGFFLGMTGSGFKTDE